MIRIVFCALCMLMILPFESSGQNQNRSANMASGESVESVETAIGYKKGLLREKLDYRLSSKDQGKFILKFVNKPKAPFKIKIYDVIGNLIHNDEVADDHNDQREYDFTERKTKIFVVKVESGQDNVIKKVNT